jgi:hypothetical protein
LEVVYRALLCRIVDPTLEHPSFFTFFSGFLYAFSHMINYFSLRNKFSSGFALKTLSIQIAYNFVFGLYISHIFTKTPTLISSLVIQVYANFMGYPDYFEVLKGNVVDDVEVRSIFYLMCRNWVILFFWTHQLFYLLYLSVILELFLFFTIICLFTGK